MHLRKVLGLWSNNYRKQPHMEHIEQEVEVEVEVKSGLLDTHPFLRGPAPGPPPAPRPALLGHSPDQLFPTTAVTQSEVNISP